ncbi:uncharacterized protein LOC107982053 [Nasonia vitripennis]|uniref:RRM domain-containing protein n=1 Tax=Nasonia vitripennis TaxID=7425 RepID=A0A7M7J411_NASVI|nr:uncharacterized protein LOC107982053 [Nasonia vitripennis]
MSAEATIQKNNRGSYSVTFRNCQALSKAEIMEIFSKYGRVLYIGITGEETGYRFVHFSTEEEAKRAVLHANDYVIKLRPHKSKPLDKGAQRAVGWLKKEPHWEEPLEVDKVIARNAAEIIVGNIPPSFAGAYLLHLFEKYVPIAMTHVMVVEKTGMRYCHVYFRSQKDVEDVERDFNNYFLEDRCLIVVRPNTLMKTNAMNS